MIEVSQEFVDAFNDMLNAMIECGEHVLPGTSQMYDDVARAVKIYAVWDMPSRKPPYLGELEAQAFVVRYWEELTRRYT